MGDIDALALEVLARMMCDVPMKRLFESWDNYQHTIPTYIIASKQEARVSGLQNMKRTVVLASEQDWRSDNAIHAFCLSISQTRDKVKQLLLSGAAYNAWILTAVGDIRCYPDKVDGVVVRVAEALRHGDS